MTAVYEGAPIAAAPAPPHSIEAEEAVLGVLFLSERPMYALAIEEGLKADHFFRPRHRVVWEAMLALYDAEEPITRVGVVELLRDRGQLGAAGGESAIDQLTGPVANAGGVRQYARIVRERAIIRQLQQACGEVLMAISDGREDANALVELAESKLLAISGDERQRQTRHVSEVLDEETTKIHALAQGDGEVTGIATGWTDFDEITGGLQPGNLVVFGARPSMGKSCAVTNIAEFVALAGKGVALFSLEMSESELAQRLLASQAVIKGRDLRKGRIDAQRWPKVLDASNRLAGAPLWIDDSSDMSLVDIRAKARRLHQKYGLGLVIVDYLQLMRPTSTTESRVQQVGEMSRGLKMLAKELQLPVIAISQLSRAVEARTDKKPILSDLRDSGNVEQDADLVVFLYREDYYDKDSERQGLADFIVAKHRNGGLGEAELVFLTDYPKFLNRAKADG